MKKSYAYQYILDLTDAQRQEIVRSAGCVRKVWNCFLAKIKKDEEKRKAKEKAEAEQAKLIVDSSTECVTNRQSDEAQDTPSEKQSPPLLKRHPNRLNRNRKRNPRRKDLIKDLRTTAKY